MTSDAVLRLPRGQLLHDAATVNDSLREADVSAREEAAGGGFKLLPTVGAE
jgi:hypothetical protein